MGEAWHLDRLVPWLAPSLFVIPAIVFFVVLKQPVALAPLTGMDTLCAKCDRKATRTLATAANALRTKGIYIYDKTKYPHAPPVWCDFHGPDDSTENAGRAYLATLVTFGILVLAYRAITRWAEGAESG